MVDLIDIQFTRIVGVSQNLLACEDDYKSEMPSD